MGARKLSYYREGEEAEKNFFSSAEGERLETLSVFKKWYVKDNHLGNVLVTLSDRKFSVDDGTYVNGVKINSTPDGVMDFYEPDVLSYADYYPGHSIMPGRSSNPGSYRYGAANGQESDAEITGTFGNHYTAEHWMYDSRLVRRWNVDPVDKPWESSYATFGGNPILNVDPNGDDWYKNNETQSVVWIESNGQAIKGHTFLGEHRYWNNVTNIPGNWVYWNFLGRGTFGNVGVIVYGSGDGSESLAGEYNNQMKIITTVDMEGDEGEVINAMGKGKSSTKFKGTKSKFSNKTIFKAVNKALKASMNSNGDYVPATSQKNNLTGNALIPLDNGNFQVYFRTSGLDGTEIYKTNYTITPEQASQEEFQGFTFPSGATENDVIEFFNIENKAAGLDGVKITTP